MILFHGIYEVIKKKKKTVKKTLTFKHLKKLKAQHFGT